MKEFTVEFITREQAGDYFNYSYSGEWASEITEAETEEEAIDNIIAWQKDYGVDSDDIICRVKA